MRMPWSKRDPARNSDIEVSKSQAAMSGPDGDGKDHDLQYWLDSGFLTLPRANSDEPPPG